MSGTIEDLLAKKGSNVLRTYYALDKAMMTAHREDRDEFAISTARELLEHPELPLLIRARACIIIGCSVEPDFLDMAKEAVRVAEMGYSRCTNPGDLETKLVKAAKECLEGAEEAFQMMEAEKEEDDEVTVWEAGDDEEGSSGHQPQQGQSQPQTEETEEKPRNPATRRRQE